MSWNETQNYFSVRRRPPTSWISSREMAIADSLGWKVARILSRRPSGHETADHFFFGLDPTHAWGLAVQAAGGDVSKILMWKQPTKVGPWSFCRTIVDGGPVYDTEAAAE